MSPAAESRPFEAEVAQVLHLVTHSLYSHKEIFLRELISNASDACDKLRFAAIAAPGLLAEDAELRIEIGYDAQARTLTVRDNGIGMTRAEVIENIGTIARSGTRKFLESLSGDQRQDSRLIGQFGVGFYSAFVVADKVELTTRKAGVSSDEGVRWHCDGASEYQLASAELGARGTTVSLHLKPEEAEFLSGWRLRELIGKYSDHIGFPIRMLKETEGKPGTEWETVNHASALWARPKSELSEGDYQGFYKHVSHDVEDAACWTHNRVEGNQSYTVLLYVPGKAPFDALWSDRNERKGLKLYVRRVFIMDASEHLLPAYLRFIKGVVDSDDLPLNVSREILQENKLVAQIRGACVKRTLDLLDKHAEDAEKYQRFWNAFGNVLKEGLGEDFTHRERIAKLLRFASTQGSDKTQAVSLDAYIARMREGQEAIYYITADSYAAAKGSPQLEALHARGVEVLLMYDRIDEWMMGYLREYAGKPLRHVSKGELDLDKLGGAASASAVDAAQYDALLKRLQELLAEKVGAVRVSKRLTDSVACLVQDEHAMAAHMQRLLREAGHEVPVSLPVLEVNPNHALFQRLAAETDGARAEQLGVLLYEHAQLAEGGQLEDPAAYVRRVNDLLLRALV
jgi:molecular chaperone HtpG